MRIESQKIKAALKKYDSETGPLSYYGSTVWGERSGVSELRKFVQELVSSVLDKEKTCSFAEILLNVTYIDKPRHIALFEELKQLFGLDNLEVYKRLKDEQLMVYYDTVFAHKNPLSAVRAIIYFRKTECEQDVTLKLNELLQEQDPYHVIETKTSIDGIRHFLQRTELAIDEELIKKKNIPLYKAIKTLDKENLINKEYLALIASCGEPDKMADAMGKLHQILMSIEAEFKGLKLNNLFSDVLMEAKVLNNPDYILAVISLLKIRSTQNPILLYTPENIAELKESKQPLSLAKVIVFNAMKRFDMTTKNVVDKMLNLGIFNKVEDTRLLEKLNTHGTEHALLSFNPA